MFFHWKYQLLKGLWFWVVNSQILLPIPISMMFSLDCWLRAYRFIERVIFLGIEFRIYYAIFGMEFLKLELLIVHTFKFFQPFQFSLDHLLIISLLFEDSLKLLSSMGSWQSFSAVCQFEDIFLVMSASSLVIFNSKFRCLLVSMGFICL